MIRPISILVGLCFAFVLMLAFVTGVWGVYQQGYFVEKSPENQFHLKPGYVPYSFQGPLPHWNLEQLQRGLKVYNEVCSACHSLNRVHFRDLTQLGYTKAQVKAFAAQHKVPGIDPKTGEAIMRPATPIDHFPAPYPNATAAEAANGGKAPPDLSLMALARDDGTEYIHSLLTGFGKDPKTFTKNGKVLGKEFPDWKLPPGTYFNPYYSALAIRMPPPLTTKGQVTFDDGTPATVNQMATDVAAFLTWAAEPTLVQRKRTGWAVIGFLLFATILAWLAKNQVWADKKPKRREDVAAEA